MCSRSFLSTVSLSPRPSTNEVVGSCFSTDNLQALTRSAEIDAAVHVGAAMSRLDVPLGASPTSLFPSDSESEPGLDTDDALLDAELHEILGEIRPPSGPVEGQMALAPPSTLQENPFSGMLESKTQCNECGFVVRVVQGCSLSPLPFPSLALSSIISSPPRPLPPLLLRGRC